MYSSTLKTRDRSSAIAAALAVQAILLFAFLNLAGSLRGSKTESALPLVKITMPEVAAVLEQKEAPRPRAKDGGASPRNVKSEASSMVLPQPPAATLPTHVLSSSLHVGAAKDLTNGASLVAGPGSGAGGSGNGVGGGTGGGSGDGAGAVEPPHLATRVLSGYDFAPDILEQWPRSATIFLRLKINAEGKVSECLIDRGTNRPAIDSELCNLAHERLRFWPALDRNGQAVPGWFGYAQPAPR